MVSFIRVRCVSSSRHGAYSHINSPVYGFNLTRVLARAQLTKVSPEQQQTDNCEIGASP